MKFTAIPLTPKKHWNARHYKKNILKQENRMVSILSEEIRKEIDNEILKQLEQLVKGLSI